CTGSIPSASAVGKISGEMTINAIVASKNIPKIKRITFNNSKNEIAVVKLSVKKLASNVGNCKIARSHEKAIDTAIIINNAAVVFAEDKHKSNKRFKLISL